MNTEHLLVSGPLVQTLAEVRDTLIQLRATLRAHLADHGLKVAGLLPLPVACEIARYGEGFREIAMYTPCDSETGREGFQTRVDALVVPIGEAQP